LPTIKNESQADSATTLAAGFNFSRCQEIELLRKKTRLFPSRIHGLAAGKMFFIPRNDHQVTMAEVIAADESSQASRFNALTIQPF
jgi:uncharacterized protein YfiM (DUF2279 family)